MQISPEQGQFMALLIKIVGGTKNQYGVSPVNASAWLVLCLKTAKMIACDIDEGWTNIAQRYWKKAGVAHKIDLRLALH